MNILKRLACLLGNHDLTVWRKHVPVARYENGVAVEVRPGNERHCKRAGCTYAEVKAVRPTKPRLRRPENPADTLQGPTT